MRRHMLAVGAWVLALCGTAMAQVGSASLVGQVVDSSQGAVPDVSIVAVQLDTNFRFEAVTNTEGLSRSKRSFPSGPRASSKASASQESRSSRYLSRSSAEIRPGTG